MSDEPEKKKFDVIEIAKKKRHAYLLEKLQKSSLTKSELEELKQLEHADLPAGVVESQDDVARTFGVTGRTIRNWIQQGMPVRENEGGYDLAEIYRWKVEKDGEDGDGGNQKHHWEIHYRQYKALLAEIEYRKALGELITKEEVDQGRVQRILTIKKALLGLPDRLAPQVVNLDVKSAKQVIKIRIEEIINDFARGGDGIIDDQSSGTGVV